MSDGRLQRLDDLVTMTSEDGGDWAEHSLVLLVRLEDGGKTPRIVH